MGWDGLSATFFSPPPPPSLPRAPHSALRTPVYEYEECKVTLPARRDVYISRRNRRRTRFESFVVTLKHSMRAFRA